MAIAISLTIVTFIPLISRPEWWIRVFDFPRLQIALLSLSILFAGLFFYKNAWYEWLISGGLCAAMAWQIYKILPFIPLSKREVITTAQSDPSRQIGVMVANVLMTNKKADSLREIVDAVKPDLLLTLESDRHWEQALMPLEKVYPYVVRCAQDNLYGMHLYSRFPLVNPRIQFLIEKDIPSIHTGIILPSGENIMLHCLHPAPPSPTENKQSSERDAELITVGRQIKQQPVPSIVTGDLNDVAWSDTTLLFRKISGLLDPRIGQGLFNTFHADFWYLRWPLDHLFHSSHFTVLSLRRLGYFGSDHFPIFCRLQYNPAMADQQQAPAADQQDKQLAEQKLAEGRENPSSS
jgi:endonuclease/exonuclease/phosphatase (EEP) superfamily protein YafD